MDDWMTIENAGVWSDSWAAVCTGYHSTHSVGKNLLIPSLELHGQLCARDTTRHAQLVRTISFLH